MHLGDVDLPDGLLEAQESGKLVVFAGAGVSIPAPSNYPDFKKLADDISKGTLQRPDDEPVDRFLGRLAQKGIHVHKLVRETLSDPNSAPNPLHSNLLRLFTSTSKLKIVTTNFDVHFTTAARSVFKDFDQIEIYSGPALPLGNSFTGIVHLHGSVEKPEERLVLTDADFGMAYLTHGWARRFLQLLFHERTVFFVGYSHNDPIMNYLARGLPAQTGSPRRFALTPAHNRERWEFLGVIPVIYPVGESEQEHAAVATMIATWADRVSMGILDQEEHIRQIVGKKPDDLSSENEDYILRAFPDVSTARFFTRHAFHPEWLRWVEKEGLLKRLFRHYSGLEAPVDIELAIWFAERFVCEYAGDALAVVQRHDQLLGDTLWVQIAFRLFRKKNPTPEPGAFAKWVPLLLESATPGRTRRLLDYILARMKSPESSATAVLLFQHLTAPRIALKKDIWGEIKRDKGEDQPRDIDLEIAAEGDEYWLNESWHKIFRPRLEQFAEQLVPVITANLQHAHLLARSFGKVYESWDWLSSHRERIESSGPIRDFTDTLVDAGRDIIELYAAQYPAKANALIQMWVSNECRLLRRLAIYGVGKSEKWSSDRRLNWIIQNDLLYAPGLEHEVFVVLRSSYAGASERLRKLLLDQAERGSATTQDQERKAYQVYNLLHWLKDSDADCLLVNQRLAKIESAHPEFRPREHPDQDRATSWTLVKEPEPVTTEELIAKTPEEQLDFLLSYNPEYSPLHPARAGLIQAVGTASEKSFNWGIGLARSLVSRSLEQSDLWPSIVQGWGGRKLSEIEWKEILGFLQDRHLKSASYQLTTLLNNGIRDSEHSIPNDCLELSFQISETLWKDIVSLSEGHRERAEDWLSVAINHDAGMLAQFWLNFIWRLWSREGGKWAGISQKYKTLFTEVLTGMTFASELARVVFASHLHFLYSSDKSWALEKVLPLLDTGKHQRWALQCWHGYLGWGKWLEPLLADLLPLYEKLFPLIGNEADRVQGRFCEHLAAIACFGSISPVEHGWLKRFLQISSPKLRRRWASDVLPMLKQLDKPQKEQGWNKWIAQYWDDRIQGIPMPLDADESGEMAEWSLHLEPVFPEAVERVISGPAPQLEHSFIYYELPTTELPELYPTPVAHLLLHLLQESNSPIYDFDRIDNLFEQLILGSVDRPILLRICDALGKIGYEGASRLRKLIPPAD